MVNSPAHLNLFGPLQREEPQQNDEKQDKIEEKENSGEEEEEEEEEVEDEDETEIQRLIRISQHHLLKAGGGMPPPKRMPQSCSAHANLGMGLRRTKRNWTGNDQKQLETSAEEEEEENEEEEDEDSDEEIFAAHNSLLPLRKSKSAFAGFQSNFVKSTKPFACPVIVKRDEAQIIKQKKEDEFGQKEIAEMIDLRRGDVLEFRVDDVPKQCRINDEAKCPTSFSSSSSLSSICPRESCWSAPACPNDSERELSSASSEEGDDLGGKFRRKRQRRRSGLRRKQTSWSAPSQLGADPQQMIEEEWKGREEMEIEGEMLEPWKRRRSVRIKDKIDNGMEEEEECRQFPDAQKWEYEGRILEEENEEKVGKDDEKNEDEEQEEEMLVPEPTNMKCLEMDEQGDEAMSTGEEEEEEEEGDEDGMGEDGLNAKQQMKPSAPSNNVHMRVFVQRNNPQMFHRRRHFPSSRSDSQLLWHRQNLSGNASRAPPPPAPFPLDEREEEMMAESQRGISWRIGGGGMAHSRTYGGFMGDEREEERGMAMNSEEAEELEIQRRLDELEKKMQMNQTTTMDNDATTPNPRENAEIDGTAHFHSIKSGNGQTDEDDVQIFEDEIIKEEKSQRDEFTKKTLPFDGHRPQRLLNSNRQISSPIRPNLLGSDELIPMADADDQPTPSNHSMAAGYYLPLPLGNRQKRQQQSKLWTNLDNSLSSSSYYSEEDEENGVEGERRGFRRSRVGGKVLMQRSAAARLCRRGSPPLAQNELMSESEISDLEQQIASGRLIKSYAGKSTGEQLLDEEEEEKEVGGMLEDEEEIQQEEEEENPKEEGRQELEGEEFGDEKNVEEKEEDEEGDREDKEEKDGENKLEMEENENDEEDLKTRNEDEVPFDGEESIQNDKQREESKIDKKDIKKRNKKSDYEEENGINGEMCQQQIFNSSSMPSIAGANSATNLEGRQQQRLNSYWGPAHVRADFWQSEYPIGEEEEREMWAQSNGHQIDYPTMMHRSLTVQSECFEGERPRRRRMLPLRPDQIEQLRRQSASAALAASPLPQNHHQPQPICVEEYHRQLNSPHQPLAPISPDQFSPPHCLQSLSHPFGQQKRRQLPKTPPSPKEAEKDPLDKIDIASATKEYLLSVLHQQNQKQQRPMELNAIAREEDGENFEEYSHASANPPVLPSPSVIQRPILPLLPLHQPQKFGHQSGALDEQQYKLSYGMDQSALKLAARRRPLSIEGSFYEDIDGLNGNLTGAFYSAREQQQRGWVDGGDDLYTPDDEGGERRRISGYNLADGAKSSSGISSCCTTSSRSNEAADADFQQLLMRRQQKGAGNGAGKMATQSSAADDPHAPTHRVQCPFMPRHADELRLERGDALHLIEKFDDHWCSALNLRTGQRGIFPEAHIVEIDLVDEICRSVLPEMDHQQGKERDTFYLTMLASIEVAHHKGNDVLVQGINKVCSMYQRKEEILVPQTVLMEISFRGIHVIDKRKKDIFRCPTFDFFYSLQNISFCGAHPQELRYFGFITKHPLLPRFACHVFMSNESTQPIVEAIGRAFKRSYDEYMAFAHPTEDIFLE